MLIGGNKIWRIWWMWQSHISPISKFLQCFPVSMETSIVIKQKLKQKKKKKSKLSSNFSWSFWYSFHSQIYGKSMNLSLFTPAVDKVVEQTKSWQVTSLGEVHWQWLQLHSSKSSEDINAGFNRLCSSLGQHW